MITGRIVTGTTATTPTTVYVSSGDNAITTIALCNTGAPDLADETVNSIDVNVYLVAPNGLSYLNKSNSLYTSFKRFQIKIILQSNDSSKVPVIKNLRALALQL